VPVARAVGPERLSGDWWEDGYARDYWRCEEANGAGELVIYRDVTPHGARAWFVHGWYD
jgi:hypothetical protein